MQMEIKRSSQGRTGDLVCEVPVGDVQISSV